MMEIKINGIRKNTTKIYAMGSTLDFSDHSDSFSAINIGSRRAGQKTMIPARLNTK